MDHLKLQKTCLLSVLLFLGAQVSFSKDLGDGMPPRYIAERPLVGLKVKLATNFTVGAWGALYYGSQYYLYRSKIDPGEFQGYDIVPGFDCSLGTMFGKVKVNAGGDLYCQERFDHNSPTRAVTAPMKYEFRPRGNLAFTVPFAGTCSMQWIQRIERQIVNQLKFPGFTQSTSNFRYRSTLKLSGPKFTALSISPFALYEGFNAPGASDYYLEMEFGFAFSPLKNMSVSMSDMICTQPERNNYEIHQFCVYLFYTIDAANGFANFIRSIRSSD